jgi:hypothetical protein
VYLGLVAFYDGGQVWIENAGLPASDYFQGTCCLRSGFHQDVGIGMRYLFPQFNHYVVRFDLAFPFDHVPGGSFTPVFTVAFDQAF